MRFTKLELEIINHRLEVPDAMGEVLQAHLEEAGVEVGDSEAFELVEKYAPDLVDKLETNGKLNPIEKELIFDIATSRTFSDAAKSCIGDIWDGNRTMTASWSSRILNTEKNLNRKLMSHIS